VTDALIAVINMIVMVVIVPIGLSHARAWPGSAASLVGGAGGGRLGGAMAAPRCCGPRAAVRLRTAPRALTVAHFHAAGFAVALIASLSPRR
jgi:hypothetical protein